VNPTELDELRHGLRDLADRPESVRTDIDSIRARGRRSLRSRRAAMATGSILALGAAAALAISVVPGTPDQRTAPAATSTRLTADHPNPFQALASFGWLPDGWRIIDRAAGDQEAAAKPQSYTVSAQQIPAKGGVRQVMLTMFQPGAEPALGFMRGGVPAKAVTAPAVNGHPAHWLQPPPPGSGTAAGEASLRVKYGTDQWAEIEVDDTPGSADVSALLYRIAKAVRLKTEPLALPLQIRGLPSGFIPTYADADPEKAGSTGWSSDLVFGPGLRVGLRLAGSGQRGTPNTKVGGHPAYYVDSTRSAARSAKTLGQMGLGGRAELLCVDGVNGLDVCFEAEKPAIALLKPMGGLKGLFGHITVLGPDQSAWTTHPLG
jgi:hypothetical protein